MSRFTRFSIRTLMASSVVFFGLSVGTGAASAGDCYVPRYVWKTIVTYEIVEQPVTRWVTKYRPCGQQFRVPVTVYETVRVPVEHRVKVYY